MVNPVLQTVPITINAGTILDAYPAVVDVSGITTAYSFNLRAKLTTTSGVALGNKLISYYFGTGTFICSALTNAIGEATCNGTAAAASVTANIGYTAIFAGDAQYSGSSDHGALTRIMGTDVP